MAIIQDLLDRWKENLIKMELILNVGNDLLLLLHLLSLEQMRGFTIFRYYLNLWKFRISRSISYSLGGTQTESNSFYCFLRISRVYMPKHDKLYEDNHRKHNYSATSSPRKLLFGRITWNISLGRVCFWWRFFEKWNRTLKISYHLRYDTSIITNLYSVL